MDAIYATMLAHIMLAASSGLGMLIWSAVSDAGEELVKITSGGTISIPKQFRRYLEMQKGDYLKVGLEGDHLVLRKVRIT